MQLSKIAFKDLIITHITFADDIMLFCHGDQGSIEHLMAGLNMFASTYGLQPNKS